MALFEQGVVVQYTGHGHANVDVDTSVHSLPDPGVPWDKIRRVIVRALGQPIEWTTDGTDPDGTSSMRLLADNDVLVLDTDFTQFRMTQSPAASGAADVRIVYLGI